ncbi:hypothetical protein GVN16_25600 [Emticicia sp. CRIBPO]|uniref:antiviral reverse transcriptase Drt3b n=1 Tax=Emticicia sp. CRIBPO TaxID=2683258 RepID=UPI0014120519|nr:antiviral reverse transcriptase Drt3b [Emticicia sp. CRIBPO]NBA89179.1 hypothetical protein [Emticicia sp. CRIBPO]
MRKRASKNIGYKKERVVLSDILPYEVPPFFSNRYFYNFLINHKISIVGDEIRFKKDRSGTLEKLIAILFGLGNSNKPKKNSSNYDYYKIDLEKSLVTIPFKFKVTHKDNDFRELTVIHPINQLHLIGFYDKYRNTILDNSSLSKFSLRRAAKVSSLKYFKDSSNKSRKSKSPEIEIIETTDKEYTSLKTFFSYKKYSNIYKFYESYEYQRAEKRFDNLLKFDVSRCFDSIYTHTLPWALINKKIVKDNIYSAKNSFGGKFDKIMQQMNYNETNGIVIGPEFSRIFAELILQRIDRNVEKALNEKGYRYKEDYDVYRYVDDFFVFYTDEKIKLEILNTYKLKLQEYNLFFNESKTKNFTKPIITNITIAKEEIRKLVEFSMIFQFYENEAKSQIGLKYYSSKDIITNYKLILSNTETSYKDLQNYFLSIIFNKLKGLIKKIQIEQEVLFDLFSQKRLKILEINSSSGEEREENEKKLQSTREKQADQEKVLKIYHQQLYKNLNEIIELTFFIYSVLPRVTYSIKVCHILFRIIDFIKNQESTKKAYLSKIPYVNDDELKFIAYDFDKKHNLFKKIFDGISIVFKRSSSSEYAEVETLYLLPIINELGHHYQFDEILLTKHFNVNINTTKLNYDINYFTIISLLNHIKRNSKFNHLRQKLQEIILKKFTKFESNNAEDTFLLIDVLTCPYISNTDTDANNFRKKVLNQIKFFDNGTTNSEKQNIIENIGGVYSNLFFTWKGSDIGIELNTKRGHSVY